LDLDEDDFFWVTEELIKIANTCCKGKIVSVLEGGYSVKGGVVSALGQSVAAHIRALLRSNKEQWANTNASSDLEKLNLKTKVKEDLKTLKRKRRKYLDDLQKIDLNEFMQENLSLTQNKLEETDQGEESQVPSYSQESEQLINEQDSQDEVLIN
jgi:tRNA U55 pseudouridine synthase TruB